MELPFFVTTHEVPDAVWMQRPDVLEQAERVIEHIVRQCGATTKCREWSMALKPFYLVTWLVCVTGYSSFCPASLYLSIHTTSVFFGSFATMNYLLAYHQTLLSVSPSAHHVAQPHSVSHQQQPRGLWAVRRLPSFPKPQVIRERGRCGARDLVGWWQIKGRHRKVDWTQRVG